MTLSSIHQEGCRVLLSPQGRWCGYSDESLLSHKLAPSSLVSQECGPQCGGFSGYSSSDPSFMVFFGTQWLSNAGNFSPTLVILGTLLNLLDLNFLILKSKWTIPALRGEHLLCPAELPVAAFPGVASKFLQGSIVPGLSVSRVRKELHPSSLLLGGACDPGLTNQNITFFCSQTGLIRTCQAKPGALTRAI